MVGGQRGAVEPLSEFQQRRITPLADGVQDAAGAFLNDGVEQGGGRGGASQLVRIVGVSVSDKMHWSRQVKEASAEVKTRLIGILAPTDLYLRSFWGLRCSGLQDICGLPVTIE